MNKSVILKIDGKVVDTFGYNDSTMVTFQIGYNPHHDKGDTPKPEYSYYCHGMEWGDECYSLEFKHGEFKEQQTLELKFGGTEPATTEPEKNIVKDEKRCSFCNKLSDDVETLIQSNYFNRICNECVDECVNVINAKKA